MALCNRRRTRISDNFLCFNENRNTNSIDLSDPFFPSNKKGGAVYAKPYSAIELSFSEFWDNYSVTGGAVYVEGTADCFGSTFVGNKAATQGGAIYASSTASLSVGRNVFAGNEAGQDGSSVFVNGGQFFASQNVGCDNTGCNGVANIGGCLQFEQICSSPTASPTVSFCKSTTIFPLMHKLKMRLITLIQTLP